MDRFWGGPREQYARSSLLPNALIDLNKRRGTLDGIPEDISLDKDGHPLCQAGFRMCSWGYDPKFLPTDTASDS